MAAAGPIGPAHLGAGRRLGVGLAAPAVSAADAAALLAAMVADDAANPLTLPAGVPRATLAAAFPDVPYDRLVVDCARHGPMRSTAASPDHEAWNPPLFMHNGPYSNVGGAPGTGWATPDGKAQGCDGTAHAVFAPGCVCGLNFFGRQSLPVRACPTPPGPTPPSAGQGILSVRLGWPLD